MAVVREQLAEYSYKPWAEAFWFALVSVVIYLGTALEEFNPDALTEWRTYIIALAGGAVRAFAGGFVAVVITRFGLKRS
jgi:hypothetical protein